MSSELERRPLKTRYFIPQDILIIGATRSEPFKHSRPIIRS